jgi:hypothetical protein
VQAVASCQDIGILVLLAVFSKLCARRVSPDTLESVELSSLFTEEMNHDMSCVDKAPTIAGLAFELTDKF